MTDADADADTDADADEAWRLAEEFDRRADEPGPADPALLDALAAAATDEVLATLFGELANRCAGEDREVADRYAAHLLALAPRLDGDGPRAVHAAVDVTTAGLLLRTGDREEARRRAQRCGTDLAELLPGLLGDREYLLGALADEDGRTAEAHDHAAAARDLFAQDERWDEAAYAAEAAAHTHPAMTRATLDDWRRAADLHVAAGRPDEARRCVEHACGRLAEAMAAPGADGAAMAALTTTARELARAQGLPALAARLGLAEAVYASETDAPWSDVLDRHGRSRRELAALDLDPVEQRGELAKVDLSLARAAVTHGRADDAERLLSAALPGLRAAGLDGESQMCEGMLRAVGAARRPGSPGGPVTDDRFTDPDVRAMLLMTDGLTLAAQGRTDEARARIAESAAVAGAATGPLRELMTEAATAAVDAAAGDRAAVPAVLSRIDARLAEGALPPAPRAALSRLADLLRAQAAGPGTTAPPPRIDDVDAAVADLRRLPADHPDRAARAAALVEALVRGNPMDDPRTLRPLDELLEIGGDAVPRRARTAARLLSLMRALAERELPDPDAAVPTLEALVVEAGDDPVLAPLLESARVTIRAAQAVHHGDAGAVTRLSRDVDKLLERMPQGHPQLEQIRESMLAAADLMAANERGDDLGGLLDRMRQAADRLPPGDLRTTTREAMAMASAVRAMSADGSAERVDDERLREMADQAERPGPDPADRALAHTAVGGAALRGGEETDLGRIDLGITHFRRALELTDPQDARRVFALTSVALGLFRRGELTNATADLREAGTVLEEAREAAGGPAHPMWQMVNEMLSHVRRLLGDGGDGHTAAIEGLRGHAWRVLAATDLEGATVAVRRAATDAVDAARQCLIANDPAGALTALDAGRGLALFAATTVDTFDALLAEAADPELARRWRDAVQTGEPTQLRSDLRRAVLRAVTEHGRGGDLLNPPAYDEIQRALVALDADALVYLVPGAGVTPGYAVCAPATGAPRYLALPDLTPDDDPDVITRGLAAVPRRDLGGAAPAGAHTVARADLVERLCTWMWRAALGPLIEGLLPRLAPQASARVQRLVLVPMGDLALLPWHAARRPRDRRHAIELIGISQTASARMLCRSAALPPVPPSPGGLVVGDPDTGEDVAPLRAARREALAIRDVFHRGARYVGRRPDGSTSPSGVGSEAEVNRWLTEPGPAAGAMLHLACHGLVRAATAAEPPTAYLLLANRTKLYAEDLIRLMAQEPERALGLVVLSACHTARSMTGYDEAYSLGTAFLAAGARSVLSTLWAIQDEATSVLMFMFHHIRHGEHLPAWAALRAAQCWMLDPDRVVPDDMPGPLRARLAPGELPDLDAWAAFVHWGQ